MYLKKITIQISHTTSKYTEFKLTRKYSHQNEAKDK